MVNFRDLLVKYIYEVGWQEGVTFIPREPNGVFDEEELTMLNLLDLESNDKHDEFNDKRMEFRQNGELNG